MTCPHDPTYRIQHEAAGGEGCPRCRQQQQKDIIIDALLAPEIDPDLSPAQRHDRAVLDGLGNIEQAARDHSRGWIISNTKEEWRK